MVKVLLISIAILLLCLLASSSFAAMPSVIEKDSSAADLAELEQLFSGAGGEVNNESVSIQPVISSIEAIYNPPYASYLENYSLFMDFERLLDPALVVPYLEWNMNRTSQNVTGGIRHVMS